MRHQVHAANYLCSLRSEAQEQSKLDGHIHCGWNVLAGDIVGHVKYALPDSILKEYLSYEIETHGVFAVPCW